MNPILIEIKQDRPGFDGFIGSWVSQGDVNLVIDVGPANTVGSLVASLRAMNIDRVDFILLTHIHIDHAGGLADFLEQFPMAKAICYAKGIKHLYDPSKLWKGSKKALGELAEFYGPMKPVPEDKLIPHSQNKIKELKIIETPGHAPHHLSFSYSGNLFAGEAAGNFFGAGGLDYLRPATPPRFFLDECLRSVDRLLALEDQPLCYAHFGRTKSSHQLLHRFRNQLLRWEELIREEVSLGQRRLVERCMHRLLEKDQDLRAFDNMEPDTQQRETFFMANSIKGYIGYIESQ